MYDVPGHLALALVGKESLAIPPILVGRVETERRAEVKEDPRADAGQIGNPVEHLQVLPVLAGLVFLRPGTRRLAIAVPTVKRLRAELRDDDRLACSHIPSARRRVAGPRFVPADVFVERYYVKVIDEVVLNAIFAKFLLVVYVVEGTGIETCRVDAASKSELFAKEGVTGR